MQTRATPLQGGVSWTWDARRTDDSRIEHLVILHPCTQARRELGRSPRCWWRERSGRGPDEATRNRCRKIAPRSPEDGGRLRAELSLPERSWPRPKLGHYGLAQCAVRSGSSRTIAAPLREAFASSLRHSSGCNCRSLAAPSNQGPMATQRAGNEKPSGSGVASTRLEKAALTGAIEHAIDFEPSRQRVVEGVDRPLGIEIVHCV